MTWTQNIMQSSIHGSPIVQYTLHGEEWGEKGDEKGDAPTIETIFSYQR